MDPSGKRCPLSCSFPAAFRTLAQSRAERKRSSSGRYGLCCPRCQNSPWAGPAPRTYGRSSNQEQGSAAPSAAQTNGIGSVSWESRQMKRMSLGKAKESGVKIWLLALSLPWAGWRCVREADCLFLTPGMMHWVLLSTETWVKGVASPPGTRCPPPKMHSHRARLSPLPPAS